MELVVQLRVFLKLHKLHIADVERLGNLFDKGKNELKKSYRGSGELAPQKNFRNLRVLWSILMQFSEL